MKTGQHINLIRNKRKMTLDQLAMMSGVSKNTLIGWIYHDNTPNIEPLIKVANTLNVSLDELVGREWSADAVPDFEAVIFDILKLGITRGEIDIIKLLITRKEEEAYRKGYEDGTADNCPYCRAKMKGGAE